MFRRLTWDAAVFWGMLALAGVVVAFSDANAAQLEVSAGSCKFTKRHGEGDWWKGSAFMVNGPDSSGCGQIGIANANWRLAYINLGRLHLNDSAMGDGTGRDPHWTSVGHLEAQGLTFGPHREWRLAGPVSFGLEGGAIVYRSRIHATGEHWASHGSNTTATLPNYAMGAYFGTALEWKIANVSIIAGVRYYPHVEFNVRDGKGDEFGPRSANVIAKLIGVSVPF